MSAWKVLGTWAFAALSSALVWQIASRAGSPAAAAWTYGSHPVFFAIFYRVVLAYDAVSELKAIKAILEATRRAGVSN